MLYAAPRGAPYALQHAPWERRHDARARWVNSPGARSRGAPPLDLAGLPIITSGERVLYTLDPRTVDALELCALWNHRICRVGDSPAHPLGDLVAGFRERDDAKNRGVLRGVFDTVTRRP